MCQERPARMQKGGQNTALSGHMASSGATAIKSRSSGSTAVDLEELWANWLAG